ncbi:MAG: hypothetical protein J6U20_01565 [Fibrobacter sp.]|nr:hypothetical protein [Fibrobacter sp.]
MRLWVITSPDDFASEYDDIEEMFRRGLTRLILDKRSRSERCAGTDEYERWLLGLPMEFRDRIWLVGSPDMAEQLDVRGCVCDARLLVGEVPESWKRINCIARVSNADDYAALPGWVSGVLVGPVFQPLSAIAPVEALGVDFVEQIRNMDGRGDRPPALILSGGVDVDTMEDFRKFEAAGVASLGGIWNYADPINAFIKLSRTCGSTPL